MPACPGSAPSSDATASSPLCRCSGSPLKSPRVFYNTSPQPKPQRSTPKPKPSQAKFSTKLAVEKWQASAKFPSDVTTAASTALRCSSSSLACTSTTPATLTCSITCARTSTSLSIASIATATSTRTASSNTLRTATKDWCNRDGKIPATRSFTRTEQSPHRQSLSAKYRATFTPPNARPQKSTLPGTIKSGSPLLKPKPPNCKTASNAPSGVRTSRSTPSPSTAR